jgi:thiosulfate dehydrogenase [quinone] large subunit
MPGTPCPDAGAARWDAVAAFTVLRIAFGFAMFMHGFGRIVGGVDVYAHRYLAGFAKVPLPHDLVVLVIYAIPYLEVVIGAAILLGLLTRWALLANAALLLVFIFGTGMQQSWSGVETQLIYEFLGALLLFGARFNTVSLDYLAAHR